MTLSPVLQRRLLLALVAVLALTTVAYVVARISADDPGTVATADADRDPTTTSSRPTTTTTAPATTSLAPATVPPAPPLTTAVPPPSTAPPAPAPAPPPPTTVPAPPFVSSIHLVTAEELGASWTPGMGCTPPEQLRRLHLSHWGYDGALRVGDLIVEAAHAERIVGVFADIYAARFPIERMVPVAAYGGDDNASMQANNTSGYNCRTVAGSDPPRLSEHAYGRAVDINPVQNPYVKGGTVDPPEGAPWADRSRHHPGMIKAGDAVVQAFGRAGWGWGGYWRSAKDYQHFSANGR